MGNRAWGTVRNGATIPRALSQPSWALGEGAGPSDQGGGRRGMPSQPLPFQHSTELAGTCRNSSSSIFTGKKSTVQFK